MRDTLSAFVLYVFLTVVMTWPLAAGLTRDVPGDLGDSLLNMWIIGWGAESVPRVITGKMSVADVWNANIFHPEPLALSFSEHLFGQVIQILPVYHLTGNLILCYNLLFLSAFALSGLGMFLLVRDITGNRNAALVAGVLYAFLPYRVAQTSHIQIMSSQWMPFALYGFRRYIITDRIKALVGGASALLMQNWSCGYYLLFFTPFVLLFVVHQVITATRARDWKVWLSFAVAALVVAAGTWPFLELYLEAQRVYGFRRDIGEVLANSADIFGYLTASSLLRVWGPILQMAPKPEGEVFLGFVPAALALYGLVGAVRDARAQTTGSATLFKVVGGPRRISARGVASALAATAAIILAIGLGAILLTGGFVTSVGGVTIRATTPMRSLAQLAIAIAALALLSPKFREVCARVIGSPTGLALISLVAAAWLSLGPVPQSRGHAIVGIGLYQVLYDYVPGFDGLRVAARYAMVAGLFLVLLAGIGLARLIRTSPLKKRHAGLIASLVAAAFLIEAAFAPLPVNERWGTGGVVPGARVEPAVSSPAVYRYLATMPDDTIVAEFPFGDLAWELRYVYYSTVHWKRILNGYSGGFPRGYKVRVARFDRLAQYPDDAWQALVDAGVTHVVVHEQALSADQIATVTGWLQSHGATEIGRFDSDRLFEVR
jgi:hypothetical protein